MRTTSHHRATLAGIAADIRRCSVAVAQVAAALDRPASTLEEQLTELVASMKVQRELADYDRTHGFLASAEAHEATGRALKARAMALIEEA
jgi:hypothetical protein